MLLGGTSSLMLDIWNSVLLGAVLKKWGGRESYTSCFNEVWGFSLTIIRRTWDLFRTRWWSCIFTVTRIQELALHWFFEVQLLKHLFTVTWGWFLSGGLHKCSFSSYLCSSAGHFKLYSCSRAPVDCKKKKNPTFKVIFCFVFFTNL